MREEKLARDTLVIALGGGQGERLYPLTRDRTKPAVPFAGTYRIVDFTLSNCLNSGLRRIYVLTQYKSISLDRHLRLTWNCFNEEFGEFVVPIPPQQRIGERWYEGTADAIFQNIYTLQRERPRLVLVLAGDHVYKMDYLEMINFHEEKGAEITVACVEAPIAEASRLGVVSVDDDGRIVQFEEKPTSPQPIPPCPGRCYVSMGIYVLDTPALVQFVTEDAKHDTTHDFGRDIFPRVIHTRSVFAYPFNAANRKGFSYWRDIGTLDAYWQANMDLLEADPAFDLNEPEWPIRTYHPQYPPARFVSHESGEGIGGTASNSIVSQGCVITDARVDRSILSPAVRVEAAAEVVESILMDEIVVGRGARVRRAIVDKNVVIPAGVRIGWDVESDRRKFTVTEKGIAVIHKDVPPSGGFWRS